MSKGLTINIMEQQQKLLFSFGRLNSRYEKLMKPLLEEMAEEFDYNSNRLLENGTNSHTEGSKTTVQFPLTEELVEKSLKFMKSFKNIPKRLKWAAFDQVKMEALIVKLVDFNDKMHEALNKAQMDLLLEMQTRTNDQIVLLNRTMSDMVQIYRSSKPLTFQNRLAITDLDDSEYNELSSAGPVIRYGAAQPLAALAQQKYVHLAIEESPEHSEGFANEIGLQHLAEDIRKTQLKLSDVTSKDGSSFPPDKLEEGQRTEALYKGTSVWVEWKTPDSSGPMQHGVTIDPKIHARVKKLAALLSRNNRTVSFRAPFCRGYFIDEDDGRFGLVFEKPASVPASTQPTSLHTLIHTSTTQGLEMPSLTSRITLMRHIASTVERLHAVDWLHKGLRSANILLFADQAGAFNYADPFLSGFDYSRPAMSDDMTERPSDNPAADIYRHPAVQHRGNRDDASGRETYKKSFDLYALGLVLLEIAHWKTIDAILGIGLDTARPRDTAAVRGRLLGSSEPQHLRTIKSYSGDALEDVIRSCLVGPEAFGLQADCDEKREVVAAGLQRAFGEKVVTRLGVLMKAMQGL